MGRDRSRFLCRFFALAGALALVILSFAPAKAADWKPMPWHLADIWWDFPAETGDFHMLSIDMEIAGQEVGDLPVYFAPIGLGKIDDAPFYAGLQSGAKLTDGSRGHLGIFSRWQERDPAAMRVAPGGYLESAGSEGDFISVRQPVAWHNGRYRVSLTVEVPQGTDPRPWVRGEVLELASGTRWQLGALRFPGGPQAYLGQSLTSFVEIFGRAVAPAAVPHFTVTFGNLRINDLPAAPTGGTVVYEEDVPPLAEIRTGAAGTLTIEVGGLHDRRGLSGDKGKLYQRFRW